MKRCLIASFTGLVIVLLQLVILRSQRRSTTTQSTTPASPDTHTGHQHQQPQKTEEMKRTAGDTGIDAAGHGDNDDMYKIGAGAGDDDVGDVDDRNDDDDAEADASTDNEMLPGDMIYDDYRFSKS